MRSRKNNELREITLETGISCHAEGSCLVSFGKTKVHCTATVDNHIPFFLRDKKQGWVTAEYSMLPRATNQRTKREISTGKPQGRTQEIQRLIGRSLRSVIDLKLLGERQIIVDCDVLQADGGTRTAAITGGYVALQIACQHLLERRLIKKSPITSQIAAISVGVVGNEVLLDLDYSEDSNAQTDANFVMNEELGIIEIQSTAEKNSFNRSELLKMLDYAEIGIKQLIELQKEVLS